MASEAINPQIPGSDPPRIDPCAGCPPEEILGQEIGHEMGFRGWGPEVSGPDASKDLSAALLGRLRDRGWDLVRRVEKVSSWVPVPSDLLEDLPRLSRIASLVLSGVAAPRGWKKKRRAAWWTGYVAALEDVREGRVDAKLPVE